MKSYREREAEVFNSRRTIYSGEVDNVFAELQWDSDSTFHLYNEEGDLVDYRGNKYDLDYRMLSTKEIEDIIRGIRANIGEPKNRYGEPRNADRI